MTDWLIEWRRRRLNEWLVRLRARMASYEYIALRTRTYYPTEHARLSEQIALAEHRLYRLCGRDAEGVAEKPEKSR